MTFHTGKIACFLAGILLGILAVTYPIFPEPTSTVVPAQAATSTPAQAVAPEVIDAVYPLYSAGIVWSPKLAVSLPPHSAYNPTGKTIVGYQVSSLPTASTEDIGSVIGPVRHSYDKLLLKKGWKIDISSEADGPGGAVWGFTKDKNILILSYTSTFMNQQANQPEQCPCTIVFTIIGGTLK